MNPYCVLKFYDSSDALQHTITNSASSVTTHQGLNEDLGFFTIQLPTKRGSTYTYYDIATNWTVKAWFGYPPIDTSGLPHFAGKVYQTTAGNLPEGYTRTITGKTLSDILQRRIKTREVYTDVDASAVIADVAAELSIYDAAKVVADTTHVTLTVDAENYLDLFKRVSDYWYDAGTQVKKDYYVDVENELVWKARPIRTTGVETLTLGQNILDYNIVRDGTQIKNHIQVYGRQVPFVGVNDAENRFLVYYIHGRKTPVDGDSYTDDAGWTDVKGVTSSANAAPVPAVGADYTRCDSEDVNNDCEFHRHWSATPISCEGYDGYKALEFWGFRWGAMDCYIRLYCPSVFDYYELKMLTVASAPDPQDAFGDVDSTWKFHRYTIGAANTYDAITNPTGRWHATGSPNWEDIEGIEFQGWSGQMDMYMGIDGLCFNFGRWRYLAEDPASQASYGQHDMVVVNDSLNSDSQCETHSQTLLYQQKDPVIRLDCVLDGNTNVLIGDQIPVTIPAENISAQNFYVTAVEQHWTPNPQGWQTVATMLNTLNTRNAPATNDWAVVTKELKRAREIGKGGYNKVS